MLLSLRGCAPLLAQVPSFGRDPRGSPDFLAYPVPKACMHACSSYWSSEVLGCRTLRLESQSSAGLRMQPYPPAPDLVWPGHLHGTGCLSARAMDTGFPTVLWRLCLSPGCAWARVSVPPPTLAGVLGECVWVRVVVSPLHSRLGFVTYAGGLGFWLAPYNSWVGFWGVNGCVRAPPVLRRFQLGCALCVCVLGLGFRLRPATPG